MMLKRYITLNIGVFYLAFSILIECQFFFLVCDCTVKPLRKLNQFHFNIKVSQLELMMFTGNFQHF